MVVSLSHLNQASLLVWVKAAGCPWKGRELMVCIKQGRALPWVATNILSTDSVLVDGRLHSAVP